MCVLSRLKHLDFIYIWCVIYTRNYEYRKTTKKAENIGLISDKRGYEVKLAG
jgi:hypothetical protein